MNGGRHSGRRWLVGLLAGSFVVSAIGCSRTPTEPLTFEGTLVPEPPPISPEPGAGADLYVVYDTTMVGLRASALPAVAGVSALTGDAVVSRLPVPLGVYDIAHLGDRVLTMHTSGEVRLVDPASGTIARRVRVTPSLLGEPVFSSLMMDETASVAGGDRAYVAGHFGRPGERRFTGFVLTFDTDLGLRGVRKFPNVVQDLTADARGGIAVNTDGEVIDVETGRLIHDADYPRAVESGSVRRDPDGGIWIGVGETYDPYVLTPDDERVDLPDQAASPHVLVPVPGGLVVITQNVDKGYLIDARTHAIRTFHVPRSAGNAVVVDGTLYVLSGGTEFLTSVTLPDLVTTTYTLPELSTLLV